MEETTNILAGIKVIDCGTYIAGPVAATVMSDFGAEVIKIERPPYGDPYRYLSQIVGMPVSEHPYCWILTSRNKKSLTLNLAEEAGRQVLLELVATADVFVTNFQPQLIAKFRLSYEELRAVNERLIFAHVTGYGELGDEARRPAFDQTAYWARSGFMGMMHNADAEPCRAPAGFGDHPTGLSLFGAIMLALYRREVTGRGGKVSTSLMANGAWANSCYLQAAMCQAKFPPKTTRRNPFNPLVNHYVTRDNQRLLFCCVDQKKDWPNLCRALGLDGEVNDPRFATPEARSRHTEELVATIDEAIAKKDLAEWTELFGEYDLVWTPVPTLQQLISDPQLEANGVFVDVEGPVSGHLRTVNSPIEIEGIGKRRPTPAPEVGEHTLEILRELGYPDATIRTLLQQKIVSTPEEGTD